MENTKQRIPFCYLAPQMGTGKSYTSIGNNYNFGLSILRYKDTETKMWVMVCKQYNITAYGKTVKEVKTLFDNKINLKLSDKNLANRVNELETALTQVKGQLLSNGFSKDSITIISIDSVLNQK